MQDSSLSIRNINLANFQKLNKLKQGGCGSVYKIVEKSTGQYYVAKILLFENNDIDEKDKEKMIRREIEIMMNADNSTLVKLLGYSRFDFNNEPNVTLIIDFFGKGSLYDLLKDIRCGLGGINYTDTTRQIIMIGISYGMKYLHNKGIIHRDLSSSNILIDDELLPRITDFGLSKYIDAINIKKQSIHCGKTHYMSPEVLQCKPYDLKADVYSFGIIMYEVVTDCEPYSESTNEYELKESIIKRNYRPDFKNPIKESLKKLIKQCWSSDPDQRPTFDEIYEKLISDEYFLDDAKKTLIDDYIERIETNDSNDDLVQNLTKDLKNKREINNKLQKRVEELESKNKRQQEYIIKTIKNKKINDLLTFISRINDQSKHKIDVFDSIFIPNEAENALEIISQIDQGDENIEQIGIYSETIKMLISNDSFNLSELIHHLANFTKVEFDLRSSDSNFESLLNKLSIIKQQVENIDVKMIHDNNKLKSISNNEELINIVTIDPQITRIEKNLFKKFELLSQITIPSSVKSLKSGCFSGCSSLIQIELPSSIKEISHNAFENCSSLNEIKIPESVTKIESYTFKGCTSLTNIEIPETVKSIGDNAFECCSSLQIFDIPFQVDSIGNRSFFGCTSLTHIFIPFSVSSVGTNAFERCSSLLLISIPNQISIESIGIDKKTKIIHEKDESISLNNFAYCLSIGDNISVDKEEAMKYYKIAISKGYIDSSPFMWFAQLFGFKESYSSVCYNLAIHENNGNFELESKMNCQRYNAGNFKVRYISSFLHSKFPVRGGGTFNIICGKGRKTKDFAKIDAFSMQSLPENDGATYLASSNFNCLELVSFNDTPHSGVTNYIFNNTQGSNTALACPQSAVYRNYFCKHPGEKIVGQLEKQINLLSKTPLHVQNGYVLISKDDIIKLTNKKFNWSDENNYAIGVHSYCDVLMTRGYSGKLIFLQKNEKTNIANHVYASSFNFGNYVVKDKFTIEIAQNLLHAEYKATILTGWENSIMMEAEGRVGAKKLYLTLLGGEEFDNPIEIITNAILSCKKEIIDSGLEVYIVLPDSSSNDCINLLTPLVEETNGCVIKVN